MFDILSFFIGLIFGIVISVITIFLIIKHYIKKYFSSKKSIRDIIELFVKK